MAEADFFTILDTTDSTNNYAMQMIHAGLAKHGMGWFAHEQTAGKGQRGKTWVSDKAKNITMSLVLEPARVHINNQFHLSAAVALTCFDFFNSYAGSGAAIKWPNDLFWRDRKAGGILLENVLRDKNWLWAVIGIGININQTEFDNCDKKPVSLKQITGQDFDIIALAKKLQSILMKNLTDIKPINETVAAYNEQLYKANKMVMLKKEGVRFETRIKEVTAQGRLITVDAIEREFNFGEVEWVL